MHPGHSDSNTAPCEETRGTVRNGPDRVSVHENDDDIQVLPPVRGLVITHNHVGRTFPLTELKKWIRLNTSVFRAEKIDLLVNADGIACLKPLIDFARIERVRLSLRTGDLKCIELLASRLPEGLLDVFLTPADLDIRAIDAWLEQCAQEHVPVRVQITPPESTRPAPELVAERLKGAVSVNVALEGPFSGTQNPIFREDGQEIVRWMNDLVRALESRGVETHLIGLPFCHVDEGNYPRAMNSQQFFLDHQQYMKSAYEFAEKVYSSGPNRMALLIENLLSRRSSLNNTLDNALLPWILGHPKAYARIWLFHKITRHLPRLRRPKALPESPSEWEAAVERLRSDRAESLGAECSLCKFQKICDHDTALFRRTLPRLRIQAREGQPFVHPLHFSRGRKRYFDVVDEARRDMPAFLEALAERAREITARQTPTREIPVEAYEIENHYNPIDDASKRWLSLSKGELLSTVLARVKPPFTMMLTFGGGIAEQIGFSFGRAVKIVCPMIDYSHKLVFHVDGDGRYVLLRDGIRVRPTEFDGGPRLPERLPGVLEPRISIHNIDGFILTQTLLLWEDSGALAESPPAPVKYSVIIVSTKYTRRLQAVLLALAHQKGIDPARLEVVVAYVPGMDATDDLLESMGQAYPGLSIVRSSFSADHARSKGFMINESLRAASGEWVVLMDSDIIIPPDMFEKIEAVGAEAHFIAPDGRRMLTPEMTSRILLGDARPWEEFDRICELSPDYRYREGSGVPCGFFQCVRREVLEKLPYRELDHFEASDHMFGKEVLQRFGPETRLENVAVLHLDHGGRQWYGTERHR